MNQLYTTSQGSNITKLTCFPRRQNTTALRVYKFYVAIYCTRIYLINTCSPSATKTGGRERGTGETYSWFKQAKQVQEIILDNIM